MSNQIWIQNWINNTSDLNECLSWGSAASKARALAFKVNASDFQAVISKPIAKLRIYPGLALSNCTQNAPSVNFRMIIRGVKNDDSEVGDISADPLEYPVDFQDLIMFQKLDEDISPINSALKREMMKNYLAFTGQLKDKFTGKNNDGNSEILKYWEYKKIIDLWLMRRWFRFPIQSQYVYIFLGFKPTVGDLTRNRPIWGNDPNDGRKPDELEMSPIIHLSDLNVNDSSDLITMDSKWTQSNDARFELASPCPPC